MKELYLVLKSSPEAYKTLEELKYEGFNATVLSAESLRHAVDYYPEEHHFFTLRHIEKEEMMESIRNNTTFTPDLSRDDKAIFDKEKNIF